MYWGKIHRKPFKPVGEIHSTRKLKLVHSDVCGPMQTESIGGRRYFVTFIDDYSRCCSVYFLRHKSEVLEKFKELEAITTNESDQRIGTLRTDNGGEYLSGVFKTYMNSKGIHHEVTVPHSPQQNGVAERMNRTLMSIHDCSCWVTQQLLGRSSGHSCICQKPDTNDTYQGRQNTV